MSQTAHLAFPPADDSPLLHPPPWLNLEEALPASQPFYYCPLVAEACNFMALLDFAGVLLPRASQAPHGAYTLESISLALRVQWCVFHYLISLPSLRQSVSFQALDLYIVSLADISCQFMPHPIQSDLLGKPGPIAPCLKAFSGFHRPAHGTWYEINMLLL